MLLLLNTTKTMDLDVPGLPDMEGSEPVHLDTARKLAQLLSKMTPGQLAELMGISDQLAADTHEKFLVWGKASQPKVPALFGFTGLLFQHLDAPSLTRDHRLFAARHARILSGLYGLLNPFDLIEDYRLEMGYKLQVDQFSNLARFWKEPLTARLNRELAPKEPIISVASQEYMKALDIKQLNRPVILPVFKEIRPDGSYKNAVVHAKKARGALVRYAIENRAKTPDALMGFSAMGWKAQDDPPESGSWLFTRPAA